MVFTANDENRFSGRLLSLFLFSFLFYLILPENGLETDIYNKQNGSNVLLQMDSITKIAKKIEMSLTRFPGY